MPRNQEAPALALPAERARRTGPMPAVEPDHQLLQIFDAARNMVELAPNAPVDGEAYGGLSYRDFLDALGVAV